MFKCLLCHGPCFQKIYMQLTVLSIPFRQGSKSFWCITFSKTVLFMSGLIDFTSSYLTLFGDLGWMFQDLLWWFWSVECMISRLKIRIFYSKSIWSSSRLPATASTEKLQQLSRQINGLITDVGFDVFTPCSILYTIVFPSIFLN